MHTHRHTQALQVTYGRPPSAKVWHIFKAGRSLCGQDHLDMPYQLLQERLPKSAKVCSSCHWAMGRLTHTQTHTPQHYCQQDPQPRPSTASTHTHKHTPREAGDQ